MITRKFDDLLKEDPKELLKMFKIIMDERNELVEQVISLKAQLAERDKADMIEPCPTCNGSGGIEGVEAVCCGNVSDDYQCCNVPVPQQVQHRCQDCNGSGEIATTGIDKDKEIN